MSYYTVNYLRSKINSAVYVQCTSGNQSVNLQSYDLLAQEPLDAAEKAGFVTSMQLQGDDAWVLERVSFLTSATLGQPPQAPTPKVKKPGAIPPEANRVKPEVEPDYMAAVRAICGG